MFADLLKTGNSLNRNWSFDKTEFKSFQQPEHWTKNHIRYKINILKYFVGCSTWPGQVSSTTWKLKNHIRAGVDQHFAIFCVGSTYIFARNYFHNAKLDLFPGLKQGELFKTQTKPLMVQGVFSPRFTFIQPVHGLRIHYTLVGPSQNSFDIQSNWECWGWRIKSRLKVWAGCQLLFERKLHRQNAATRLFSPPPTTPRLETVRTGAVAKIFAKMEKSSTKAASVITTWSVSLRAHVQMKTPKNECSRTCQLAWPYLNISFLLIVWKNIWYAAALSWNIGRVCFLPFLIQY